MPLFKTSNPALGSKTFQDLANRGGAIDAADRMSVNGTVNRTGLLLVCAFATAAYTWHSFMQTRDPGDVSGLLLVGVPVRIIGAPRRASKRPHAGFEIRRRLPLTPAFAPL